MKQILNKTEGTVPTISGYIVHSVTIMKLLKQEYCIVNRWFSSKKSFFAGENLWYICLEYESTVL